MSQSHPPSRSRWPGWLLAWGLLTLGPLAVAQAPVAASGAASAASAPASRLEFSPASPKPLTVGVLSSRTLVKMDPKAYTATVPEATTLPPGTAVGADGVLRGTPTLAGRYRFTVQVVEAPAGPEVFQQTFSLLVQAPGSAPAAAAPRPASAPAALQLLKREAVDGEVDDSGQARVLSWRLGADDLAKLKPDEPAAAAAVPAETPAEPASAAGRTPASTGSAAKPVAACMPTVASLEAMLKPMLETEYPTQALFEAALSARQRAACELRVKAEARRLGVAAPEGVCRPAAVPGSSPASTSAAARPTPPGRSSAATASAAASAPAAGCEDALTPAQVYDALLPESLRAQLLAMARKPRYFSDAPRLRWSGAGCGCGPVNPDDQVYGLAPFWPANLPAAPRAAEAASAPAAGASAPGTEAALQQIDFSLFTRIGYLGLYLEDNGSLTATKSWDDRGRDGLREALRHGTKLDLVLYRNEWPRLLALSEAQRDQRVRSAVAQTVERLQRSRFDDWQARLRPLLLPFWPEPAYLYSGVTVFFDYSPPDDPALAKEELARFRSFYRSFVLRLIDAMEATGRDLALNLVVPDQQLGQAGSPYSFEDLVEVLQRTRTLATEAQALSPPPKLHPQGPQISTRLLVLLSEPTSVQKKELRLALDRTEVLQSHMRIGFLKAVLPVMFFPTGAKPDKLDHEAELQFDADLVYASWQFGGVGLWPLPAQGLSGSAQVVELLQHNFRDREDWWTTQWRFTPQVCAMICPHRSAWRLTLNGLLLGTLLIGGLLLASCRARALGWPLKAALGLCIVGAVVVFWGLLVCDPDLAAVRQGNLPLAVIVVGLLLWALKRAFTQRVPMP